MKLGDSRALLPYVHIVNLISTENSDIGNLFLGFPNNDMYIYI